MKKHTYDDNGNMSSKVLVKGEDTTETQFTYDGFDRTTGIKIGDVTTSFDYNTDSDRVSKTTNGKVTESILDNGSVSADLIGETLKVFSEDNSVFCQNGMFSYNVINTKGDIIASDGSNGIDYNYNAYGTELYNCSSANPIGYRNYYYDSETGLYYLKARYYDPTTGQFTQEDTVQDDNLQYNLYGYCSGNPVLYTDPSGHNKVLKNVVRLIIKAWKIGIKINLDYCKSVIAGAANAFLMYKDFKISRRMFNHAMYGYGGNLSKDCLNSIEKAIKNSSYFKKNLNENLKYAVKRKYVRFMNYPFEFKKGDLYYSLQHVNCILTGNYKKPYWNLKVSINDFYDFDNFRAINSILDIGSMANNLGLAMQKIGMIVPYFWGVDFNYKFKM